MNSIIMAGMALTDKGITSRDAMTPWLRSSAGLLGQLHWRQVAGGLSNITYRSAMKPAGGW
jgi:hypothetical protein